MAVVFVQARPKGKSNDGPVTDYVVRIMRTTFWQHSKHKATRYFGRKSRITRRTSRAFAI